MSGLISVLGDVASVVDCEHKTAPRAGADDRYGFSIGTMNVRRGGLLLEEAKPVTKRTFQEWTRRAVPEPGDLILSREAPMGEVGEIPAGVRVCLGQRTVLLRLRRDQVDAKYLKYLIMSPSTQHWIRGNAAGSTVLHLNVADVRRLPLGMLPALHEQRRTVETLEDHLSRLDAAGETLTRSLRKARMLVAVAVQHEFQNGDVRLASIDEVTGGDRSATTIGPFGSSLKTSDYTVSGVPLIFVRNVRAADFREGLRYVSTEKAHELRAHMAQPGDLLIAKMGDPPGDASVYEGHENGVVTADVIRLRPAPGFDARYLAYAFQAPDVRRQILQITRGVAQKKVSLARFRSAVRLPVMSFERQRELAARLDQLVVDVQRLRKSVEHAELRSEVLRSSLLAHTFSGWLSGRGAGD